MIVENLIYYRKNMKYAILGKSFIITEYTVGTQWFWPTTKDKKKKKECGIGMY